MPAALIPSPASGERKAAMGEDRDRRCARVPEPARRPGPHAGTHEAMVRAVRTLLALEQLADNDDNSGGPERRKACRT